MKVLVRQSNKQMYYAGAQEWTADMRGAVDFDDLERAIKTARDEELTGVEAILSFEDGGDDLVLPINPHW
jgi:hypothetical protein